MHIQTTGSLRNRNTSLIYEPDRLDLNSRPSMRHCIPHLWLHHDTETGCPRNRQQATHRGLTAAFEANVTGAARASNERGMTIRPPTGVRLRPQNPEAEALEIVLAGIRDVEQDEPTYDLLSILYDEDKGEAIGISDGYRI